MSKCMFDYDAICTIHDDLAAYCGKAWEDTMTKKDFVALAAALKSVKPLPVLEHEEAMWRDTVGAIAAACRKSNDEFNSVKFFAAAGY